jgi:hypothetical protein
MEIRRRPEKEAQKPYNKWKCSSRASAFRGTAFGSAIDEQQITREKRVRNDLPPSYVPGTATDRSLKGQYSQLVAAHDITEGLPIVSQDFVQAGQVQAGGVEGQLTTDNAKLKAQGKQGNLQALTLTFDDTHAVGGFLTPGDKVNRAYTRPHQIRLLAEADAIVTPTRLEADAIVGWGIPRERLIVPMPLQPFDVRGVHVEPIHAIHGNQDFTVLTREPA